MNILLRIAADLLAGLGNRTGVPQWLPVGHGRPTPRASRRGMRSASPISASPSCSTAPRAPAAHRPILYVALLVFGLRGAIGTYEVLYRLDGTAAVLQLIDMVLSVALFVGMLNLLPGHAAGQSDAQRWPGGESGSGGERRSAATGAGGVRVEELEPGAVQAGDVVERHPCEVLLAGRVDEDAHAVLLEDRIVRRRGFLEGQLVLKTRAAAADDAHPQAESDDLLLPIAALTISAAFSVRVSTTAFRRWLDGGGSRRSWSTSVAVRREVKFSLVRASHSTANGGTRCSQASGGP